VQRKGSNYHMAAPPPLNDLNAPSRFWLYLRVAMADAAAMEVCKARMYTKTKTAVRYAIKADLLGENTVTEPAVLTNLFLSLGDTKCMVGLPVCGRGA